MKTYKIRTDYFSRPWTWAKKIGMSALFTLFFVVLLSGASFGEFSWIVFAIYAVLTTGVITGPTDDLAFDGVYFYHLKTSVLPALSKVNKFEITKIKSIRSGGRFTKGMDVFESLTVRGRSTNIIEITMMDDTYQSLDVAIYKEDISEVLAHVRALMPKEEPMKTGK